MTFEYQCVELKVDVVSADLTAYGQDGWELVSVLEARTRGQINHAYFYFKRAVLTPASPTVGGDRQ